MLYFYYHEVIMKKVLFTLLIISLAFWGCSEDTNLTGPEKIDAQKSFLKVLPNSSNMLIKTTASKTIDGDFGGLIPLNLESVNEEYGAKGWLYFPRESFDGTETISVTIANDIAACDFGPSGIQLDSPARLTLKFNGVEFNGDDDDEIDFQYIDSNGGLATVDYRKLIVNKNQGWVIVIDAKLDHFSRYGFTK